jgi:hypothetical protein
MDNPLFIKRTAAIETDRNDKNPSKTLMAQGLPIEKMIAPGKGVTADVAADDTERRSLPDNGALSHCCCD